MAYSDDKKKRPNLRPNKPPYGRPANPKNRFNVSPGRKAVPDKEEIINENRHSELEGEGMRLNKFIAHCGICSRRQAADYVKEGFVTVNDQKVLEPYLLIKAKDKVCFKGKAIYPQEERVYYLMNKPKGVITTAQDERGRKTVLDILPDKGKTRVFPVGRLDRETTGLLLLTNDGDLALKMTHPGYKMKKVYQVTLDKSLSGADVEKIQQGVVLEDGPVPVDALHFIHEGSFKEVSIAIHIGRNRIVRRLFEHLGYEVVKLDRTYLGGLTKKDLPRGFTRKLTGQEIIMLKHFTGK
ncbi:MAG: rRNA pseudouridine synthase [Bacteroidetes bacterium]|nr:rRNA pseudouridine synthase [Bacteroidota bacterium]